MENHKLMMKQNVHQRLPKDSLWPRMVYSEQLAVCKVFNDYFINNVVDELVMSK